MKKKLLSTLVATTIFAVGCGNAEGEDSTAEDTNNNDDTTEETANLEGVPEALNDDIKVAVIRNLPSDDHTTQFLDGARTEGESFGFEVDTYISDGDDARFQDLVSQAINGNYDGMIISHGKESYSYNMIEPAIDKGIEVVTFDTVAESNGETLEGVTSTAQNDALLAEYSLEEAIHFSENEVPNIIKITVGGVVPLDNRDVVYQQYEEEGKINTLQEIGPQNMQSVISDITSATNSILSTYGEGEIDIIWAAWDELAKGAYNAIKENGRSDVDLVSIDVSNQDINFMTEENSTWLSTAAVDPHLIGVMNMRLLAMKIAGEDTPDTYELEPHIIRQEDLDSDTVMNNLSEVIDGWGESEDFNLDWMETLRENN